MKKYQPKNILLVTSLAVALSACGGGSSNPGQSNIVITGCSTALGDGIYDSTEPNSTIYTKSHLLGTPKPVYHIFITRNLADNNAVTLDYIVHNTATPKGIMVLIAGGGLQAMIDGPEGGQPTSSSGNFVVRSAHRYQAAGYRVITIDRPSDAAGNNVDMDTYRHSMRHAVDIANILKRENTDGYNVIISGTSRGSISAAAMNTLVAGIAMSSPLTSGAGYPVGSTGLPLSRIKRPSHIMLHTSDTCAATLPADSRNLFNDLETAGVIVAGNEVIGGFRDDSATAKACGAFDFHGFNGIETCAVEKETTWANGVMLDLAANSAPKADNLAFNELDDIALTATDADVDPLTYAVPYATSSLGGAVATDTAGTVTYTRPNGLTVATVDTFAFSVTDGKGGVSTAVVSISLPII